MKTKTLLKLMATGLLIVASAVFLAACSDSADEASSVGDLAEHLDDSSDADLGAGPTDVADTSTDEHAAGEHAAGAADVEVSITSEGATFTPDHPPAGGGDVDLSIRNDSDEPIVTMVHVHGVEGQGEAAYDVGEIVPGGAELVTITLPADADFVFAWESPMIHVEPASGHNDGHDGDEHTDAVEVAVSMVDELRFEPSEIVVEAGHPVRLTIENLGLALHDFTIDDMAVHVSHHEGDSNDMAHMEGQEHEDHAVHMALDGGTTGTIEFTPEEAGEYQFHCTVLGHTEAGMIGTLIVTEA